MNTYMITYSVESNILMLIVLFVFFLYNTINNFIHWFKCKEIIVGTIISIDEFKGRNTTYYTPICEYSYNGHIYTCKVGEKTKDSYIIGTKLEFKIDKNNPTYTYRPTPDSKFEILFLLLGIIVMSLLLISNYIS